jgi:putative ABC transport system permease protein
VLGGGRQYKAICRGQEASITPISALISSGESFTQDLKFASRQLWRSPGFAIVALLTLAVGIGVNSAVFTVANTALFKGFPLVQDNHRVVYLTTTKNAVSYPDYQDWQSQAESFAGIALVRGVFSTFSNDGVAPATYFTTQVTANAFTLLGVKPILGRDFLPSDQHPGAAPVVILRNDLWRSRFAASPSIIGATVRLNGVPTTVIGVMPVDFSFPENQALWTPLVPTEPALKRETFYARYAFGRLAQGATRDSAAAEMETIGRRLASTYPDTNDNRFPILHDFREFFIGDNGTKTYQALWGAVGLVLLIACGNVANLLLNRSIRRARDMSVRLALGAGRGQIVRLILLESLLLSGLAGIVGWWIAQLCVRAYVLAQVSGVTAVLSYTADAQFLGYAVVVSIGSGVLVSVPAALWMTRSNINHTLQDNGRGVAGGGRTKHFADLLIAAEIALALIVLAGAGLMARSVFNVHAAKIGVNPANVLTMSMYIPREQYPGSVQQISFYQRLIARLEVIPGVQFVAIASVPPTDRAAHAPYEMANAVSVEGRAQSTVGQMTVSPEYFRTMEASIVSGRDFNDLDGPSSAPVGIVNQSFVRRHSPAEPVLGKRLRLFQDGKFQALTIVGVASDIVQSDRTRQDAEPLVYVPYQQRPQQNMFVFARTRVEPAALVTEFSAQVYEMDANLPVPGLMPLADRFSRAYRFESTMTTVFVVFASLALSLAVVGLYAIVAHSVRTRTREIGIRRALGASTSQIRSLVLSEAAVPLVVGLTTGILVSVALAPVLEPILVRVSSVDPATLAAASLTLAVSAAAGCLLPTRHALQIDPAITLRHE